MIVFKSDGGALLKNKKRPPQKGGRFEKRESGQSSDDDDRQRIREQASQEAKLMAQERKSAEWRSRWPKPMLRHRL